MAAPSEADGLQAAHETDQLQVGFEETFMVTGLLVGPTSGTGRLFISKNWATRHCVVILNIALYVAFLLYLLVQCTAVFPQQCLSPKESASLLCR